MKATKDAEDQAGTGHPDVAQRHLNDADSLATLAAQADPKWADPLVTRAQVAYRRARLTKDQTATTELIQQGVARADQALELDSLDADALEMRGTLQFFRITRGYVPDQNEASQIIAGADLPRLNGGRASSGHCMVYPQVSCNTTPSKTFPSRISTRRRLTRRMHTFVPHPRFFSGCT